MRSNKEPANLEGSFKEEYRKVVHQANLEIQAQLKIASEALEQAEKISEKYGVPFDSFISPLEQEYRPGSMETIWGADRVSALRAYALENYDADFIFPEDIGWQHSMVCW